MHFETLEVNSSGGSNNDYLEWEIDNFLMLNLFHPFLPRTRVGISMEFNSRVGNTMSGVTRGEGSRRLGSPFNHSSPANHHLPPLRRRFAFDSSFLSIFLVFPLVSFLRRLPLHAATAAAADHN